MCAFGQKGVGWYRCQTPPTAPRQAEKLIGSIWQSGSPSAHLCIFSFRLTPFPSHPSCSPVGVATPDTHTRTPGGLQAVIGKCVRRAETGRVARPPAAIAVPREMWGDSLASLCQSYPAPEGVKGRRDGERQQAGTKQDAWSRLLRKLMAPHDLITIRISFIGQGQHRYKRLGFGV